MRHAYAWVRRRPVSGANLRGGRGMGGGAARLLSWALAAAALGAACLPGGARAQQLPNGTYPPVDPALYAPLQLVGATTGASPGSGCDIPCAGLHECMNELQPCISQFGCLRAQP